MRIAVIGAGAAGLVSAKCLRDEGLEPIVFERTRELGGLWNWHPELSGGGWPAYRSLRANTSRQKTPFSELDLDPDLPDFPARADVLTYLHRYAERFDLRRHVRFEAEVLRAQPDEEGWQIETAAGSERADALVVATGAFGTPFVPPLPGRESLRIELVHSRDYSVPESFAGRDVVVIGGGSSAADIAVELAGHARSVALSIPAPTLFVPKYVDGRPYDHRATRAARLLPRGVRARREEAAIRRSYRALGVPDPRAVLPMPPFALPGARTTPSGSVVPLVAAGAIVARPRTVALERDAAVFADGTRARADVVLAATGYAFSFPFLPADLLDVAPARLDLYKLVFPPGVPRLAFVAMCRVSGPVPPIAEMQARWIARVFSGRATLPPPAAMRAAIAAHRSRHAQAGTDPMRAVLLDYLDDVGGLISARPRLSTDPRRVGELLFGPVRAAQYR